MGGRRPAGGAHTGAGERAEAVSARGRGLHGVAAIDGDGQPELTAGVDGGW